MLKKLIIKNKYQKLNNNTDLAHNLLHKVTKKQKIYNNKYK